MDDLFTAIEINYSVPVILNGKIKCIANRLMQLVLLTISTVTYGFAGQIDTYYLNAFHEKPEGSPKSTQLAVQPSIVEVPHCGTPLKRGLKKDWNLLEVTTQKVLGKQLASPVLASEAIVASFGGHFRIHYATSGSDTPVPGNGYTLQSWIQQVGDTFEAVYTSYNGLDYHLPPIPYNIYLRSLANYSNYGVTSTTTGISSPDYPYASDSYIEIDKDFTDSLFVYAPGGPFTTLQSLQSTAAHEFQHAIQFGYNRYFEDWYGEATATWFEDELYPGIGLNNRFTGYWFNNSHYQLDLPVSDSTILLGAGYGRWIFNRYLAESHSSTVIRVIWEKLASMAPVNEQDIPIVQLIDSVLSASYGSTFGTDLLGFAKRVYTRDWTSHIDEIGKIAAYFPVTFSSYPVNDYTGTNFVNLPRYSFAYYKFTSSAATPALILTLNKTDDIKAVVFKKASGSISEVKANISGNSYALNSFDEVVLLIANTTDVDNRSASFYANGNTLNVTEPIEIQGKFTVLLPRTGQSTSYAAGDDGALLDGVAWPTPRFTDNNDGTVSDNLTGLIWLQNANCFGSLTWTNALFSANNLASGACGLSDDSSAGQWRLPNRKELLSLVDFSQFNPAIPQNHPFSAVQAGYYWSSSSYAIDSNNAWYMNMRGGSGNPVQSYLKTSNKNSGRFVWPVRAGR